MIEFDALKNFCSVNYSLKGLISFAQAHVVSNMVLNGNGRETFMVPVQVKWGILRNSLLNKSLSE